MPYLQTFRDRNGGLAAELWKLLQTLGGFDCPMYRGSEYMVNGRDRGVICHLTVYARKNTRASQPLNISVRRTTFRQGIQESSRLAILRVCHIYAQELQSTVFRYHPRSAAVDRCARFPSTNGEGNATVVHLAQFAAAQEESLELMATELDCAYEAWERAEERIAVLEQALYGQHQPEGEAEEPEEEEDREEDPEEEPEEEEDPEELPEAEEPEEPAVPAAPEVPVPAAPVPGHQDQFARMPAQLQVYSRRERRRGCGGFLE